MDGQNFENGQNQQNAEPVVEPANNTNTYQDNTSAYTGTYQDNTSTYTGTYQDNASAYTGDVYGGTVAEPASGTPGLAIGALVCSILGLLTVCCGCLSIILSIAGLVMAIIANKKQKSGVGTAALICSIIAIVLGCIMTGFALIGALADM